MFAHAVASAPRAVAVLRFSAAGDVVLTGPALRALARAWPQTRRVFVTHAHFASLAASLPGVDQVIGLPRGGSVSWLRRRLQDAGCDAVLDLQGKLRCLLLRASVPTWRQARWVKRPWRQSLAVRWGGARVQTSQLIAQRYHAAVERLVGRKLPPEPMDYRLAPADTAEATAKLAAAGLRVDRALVAMSPGAAWETKRWPANSFAALARWLLARDVQVVLTGSPAERDLAAGVQAAAPGTVNLAGELSLGGLGGLIACCTAFVANDSGPMHMARALGVPTLAIFGSTDPQQFDFTGHSLLFAGVECSPCSFYGLRGCPRGHLRCLTELRVEQAQGALLPLLTRGPVPRVAG